MADIQADRVLSIAGGPVASAGSARIWRHVVWRSATLARTSSRAPRRGRRSRRSSSPTWAMQQVMAGEATSAQLAGFLVALRAKGETVDEIVGFRDAVLEAALPLTVDPDRARHRRHRAETASEPCQHLDHGGGRRRGIRCSRRQARQPAAQVGVGLLRRARGARHRPRHSRPSGSPRCSRETGITFAFAARSTRASATPGRRGASSACRRLQLPRAAVQPRARRGHRRGRRAARPRAAHHRRVPDARRDGARLPRRRRPRRADHDGPQPDLGGEPRRRRTSTTSIPRISASPLADIQTICWAATPRTTPRSCARCSRASRAPCATSCC